MAHPRSFTPALIRRALCFVAAAGAALTLWAATPPARPPDLAQVGKPDATEAARLLEQFRGAGIPGDYYLEFALHSLPRRGEEQVFQGRYWGTRSDLGTLTRVELTDGAGNKHRLLLQNGAQPGVWRWENGRAVKLDTAQLFEPLIPGVEITAFDVQMPFLYWPDATLERISRVRGRPTHAFLFRAPPAFAAAQTRVSSARAYLDTAYNALLQTELLGANGRPVKTFSLLSLKTVDRQPLPKSADYRNEVTRDKTRLVVNGAALNLQLSDDMFEPASLGRDAVPPAGVVRIDG